MEIQQAYANIRYLEIEIAGAHSHSTEIEAWLRATETHLQKAAESFLAAMTMKPEDEKEDVK